MTTERRVHPLSEPTRELRRLGCSTLVPTTYVDHQRVAEPEVVDEALEESRGYQDGYARGLAAAQDEVERARGEFEERARRAAELLGRAAEQLRHAREELRGEFERHLPDLVVDLVSEILGYELRTSENPGRGALERALRGCDDRAPSTVRMNPNDLDSLGDVADVVGDRAVVFVADGEVESGGVVVETGDTTLDGRVGTALERIRRVLSTVGRAGVNDDRAA